MFRLSDMFGRSSTLRALDDALRASGVHPLLVPEPVKLTVIKLSKKLYDAGDLGAAFTAASELLAYCMLGHAQFADSHSAEDAEHVDNRVEAALIDGDTFDAKLILLTLHAGLISPEIADRIDQEEP